MTFLKAEDRDLGEGFCRVQQKGEAPHEPPTYMGAFPFGRTSSLPAGYGLGLVGC